MPYSQIIVVRTCDGDMYFRGTDNAARSRAVEMATEQVLTNDLSRYSEEDRTKVRFATDSKLWNHRWQALKDCGAIREASFS